MRIGSLFSGIDGLGLGLERAGLGNLVWRAETDQAGGAVLARHWPGVPNLVDVLCGGFPCQPSSSAGKRLGRLDPRWMWPEMARVVECLRPPRIVVENVRGLLTIDQGQGFAGILADLDDMGYSVRWWLQSAASVGAPHKRERVFIVASTGVIDLVPAVEPAAVRVEGVWDIPKRWPVAGEMSGGVVWGKPVVKPIPSQDVIAPLLPTPTATDAKRNRTSRPSRCLMEALQLLPTPTARDGKGVGLPSRHGGPTLTGALRLLPAPQASDASGGGGGGQDSGDQVDWGIYTLAIRQWESIFGAPAPDPLVGRSLSADFVEWMMGFPSGWTNGLARTVRLRLLGNSVLPQVAEKIGRVILDSAAGATAKPSWVNETRRCAAQIGC